MRVDRPRIYERVIDTMANIVIVPVSWVVGPLGFDGPAKRRRSPYRVVARNRVGKQRTLAVLGSAAEAEATRREVEARLETIGIAAWAEEMRGRIPAAFFENERTAD